MLFRTKCLYGAIRRSIHSWHYLLLIIDGGWLYSVPHEEKQKLCFWHFASLFRNQVSYNHAVGTIVILYPYWTPLLPVRSMREGCAFVSVCVCIYMCVVKKHACSHLTARNSPRKNSLQLLHWIYSPMKTFSVLASLARAANPWLSNATCPCKSTLRYCGCVTQPPIHVDVLTQSHMYTVRQSFLRPIATVWWYQSFLRPSVVCQSTVRACMLPSIFLELSMG